MTVVSQFLSHAQARLANSPADQIERRESIALMATYLIPTLSPAERRWITSTAALIPVDSSPEHYIASLRLLIEEAAHD